MLLYFCAVWRTNRGAEQHRKSWWPLFQSSRCGNDSHYPEANSEQLYDEIWASLRTFCDLWTEHNSGYCQSPQMISVNLSLQAPKCVCKPEKPTKAAFEGLKWRQNERAIPKEKFLVACWNDSKGKQTDTIEKPNLLRKEKERPEGKKCLWNRRWVLDMKSRSYAIKTYK